MQKKSLINLIYNKSILIVGLGITGFSAFEFLKKIAHDIKCTDDKLEKLHDIAEKYGNNHVIETNTLDDAALSKFDYIFISPGIPHNHFLYKYSVKNNVLISDLDILFLSNPNAHYVGVTGTDGKSTMCTIIHNIMLQNKLNYQLGGNIGIPVLELPKADGYILEISSYQLDLLQLSSLKIFQLDIGILLNVHEDHLDTYGNMSNYVESKSSIFKLINTNGSGIICINSDICRDIASTLIKRNNINNLYCILDDKFLQQLTNMDIKQLEKIHFLKLNNNIISDDKNSQKYNLDKFNFAGLNTSYACAVAMQITKNFSFNIDKTLTYLKNFKGLKHRLQVVIENKNVVFINDSKSTNINCCLNAIASFENIYWIAGGVSSNQDLSKIFELTPRIIKAYFFGEAAHNLFKTYSKHMQCNSFENLSDVFMQLKKDLSIKNKPDNSTKYTILFCPGHKSFDQFENFVSRGNYFIDLCFNNFIK